MYKTRDTAHTVLGLHRTIYLIAETVNLQYTSPTLLSDMSIHPAN